MPVSYHPYKISVIVPIFGVEKFIRKCVETLMEQTLQEVEYIFVNDATPDGSVKVLKEVIAHYPQRLPHVRIIEHEANKGLPAARNTGLSYATGEYVFHCDSDDYLELDALERLYNAAIKHCADIAWGDFFEVLYGKERYMSQTSFNAPYDAIKAMLKGDMYYNVWNKLVRRSIYVENSIFFPDGYTMGEDLTMIMLYACSTKIVYVPYPVYHYLRINPAASTKGLTREKQEALNHNVYRLEKFLREKFGNEFEHEINCSKLNSKWLYLVADSDLKKYRMWNEWFPEANGCIWQQDISFRMKLLEWAAREKQYWIIWLHYWIVVKLFYKLMHKTHYV